jgi:hypothetical protein
MILRNLFVLALASRALSSPLPDSSSLIVEVHSAPCTTYTAGIQDYAGVTTVYTATATVYEQVDCGGCVLKSTVILPAFAKSSRTPSATIHMRGTATTTSSICSPTVDTGSPSSGFDPCAAVTCLAGSDCRVRDGKAVCIPGSGSSRGREFSCGNTTCTAGMTCCNASCGICTPPGQYCIQMYCGSDPMTLEKGPDSSGD